MNEYLQWIISAAILAVVGFAAFRGGVKNPVGTGQLLHDVNNIKMKVAGLEALPEQFRPIRHLARNTDMKVSGLQNLLTKMPTTETLMDFEREVEARLSTVEERMKAAATREDVARVEESLKHVCRQNDKTDQSVVRIEQHLLGQAGSRRR